MPQIPASGPRLSSLRPLALALLVPSPLAFGAPAPTDAAAIDPCGVQALGIIDGGWVVGTATVPWSGGGRARAEAQLAADTAAQADLRGKACAGVSEADCALVLRYAYAARGTPWVDEDARRVCAVYGIPNLRLQSRTPSLADAERAVDALAQTLTTALGSEGKPLAMPPVGTAEGCVVPELAAVGQRVRNGLRVPFVEPGTAHADVRRLRLLAADAGETDVQLTAEVVEADGSFRTLDTTRIPRAAYGVDRLPTGACRGDAALGLVGGRRAARDGTAIDLVIDTPQDSTPETLCSGQAFTLQLATSAPVRVHLYSVGPDGTAYHAWPPAGGSGRLTGTQSLGQFSAAPMPGGDERLVAVALPEGAPLGAMDTHSDFCKVTGFVPPPEAAVSTVTYRLETNAARCAGVAQSTYSLAQIEAALAKAPRCATK